MALFSSPHLLLWCQRPSLLLARSLSGGSAGGEGDGYHDSVFVQTATRAAAQAGGVLIRKMRPFEESYGFASHNDAVVEHPYGVLNTVPRPLRLCHNLFWSLRATKGSAAIPLISTCYEIALSPGAPRNDITTQSLWVGIL
jgi:hypothetical protein